MCHITTLYKTKVRQNVCAWWWQENTNLVSKSLTRIHAQKFEYDWVLCKVPNIKPY